MKRFILIWLSFALLISGCTSEGLDYEPDSPKSDNPYFVDIKRAIEIADEFFCNIEGEPGTRTPKVVKNVEVYKKGNLYTRSSDITPDFYLINYMNEGGFALMSTDSRKLPVYAFSTEGHMSFSDTLQNEGLRNYLSVCAGISPTPIDSTLFPPYKPDVPIYEGQTTILIPPMLNKNVRNWDQYGLNKYVCEKWGPGLPVGCTAIATAQIMSYFRWPNRWPVENTYLYKERYTFNWSEMLKTEYNDDSARFIEILSRHLDINYNDGSSAYAESMCIAFNEMGYTLPFYIPYNRDIVFETL